MPEWVGSGAQRHCIGQKELSFSLLYNGAETKIQFLRQRLSRARSQFTDRPPSVTPPLRNRPHAGILPTCCSGALLFITPPSLGRFLPSVLPSRFHWPESAFRILSTISALSGEPFQARRERAAAAARTKRLCCQLGTGLREDRRSLNFI